MSEDLAPHSSKRVRSGPTDSCSDDLGLRPGKDYHNEFSLVDVLKRYRALPGPTPEELKYFALKDAEEIPEADLKAFLSYNSLPERPAWSSISREDYEYVKRVFAQRGVPICEVTSDEDIIKFKEALLARDEGHF